jgi:hypothetical protein
VDIKKPAGYSDKEDQRRDGGEFVLVKSAEEWTFHAPHYTILIPNQLLITTVPL